jgi:hypothetical protein
MSSISSIPKNYTVKRDDPKIITKGTFPQLLTALNENKGYHQLLFHDINYDLFFDIDKEPKDDEKSVYSFFEYLSDDLYIDLTDIKYTKSEKDDTYSYHVVIPKYNTNLKTQLYLIKQIKDCSGFSEIDLAVYENKRWFRLPNQSNKEKPIVHSIINGKCQISF